MKNPIILFTIISAILLGVRHGFMEMKEARAHNTGIEDSDNIFKFFFCDKY